MSAHIASCTLCKNQGSRRISPELAGMYAEAMQRSPEDRKSRIRELLDVYPPCAMAKMAVVYGNREFASFFSERYGVSRKPLPPCEYRNGNGTAYAQRTKLFKVARLLEESLSREPLEGEALWSGLPQNEEDIFGVPLPSYDLESQGAGRYGTVISSSLQTADSPDISVVSVKEFMKSGKALPPRKKEKSFQPVQLSHIH